MNILQIANYTEGGGGISVQVKQLQRHLLGEGIHCDILSTKGSLGERFRSVIKLIAIGHKYDVFHVHACSNRGFLPAIIGISCGRLFRRRILLTFHGGEGASFFEKREKLVRFFLSKTDANIVLSGYIGSLFDKFGFPYVVIPNIIEPPASVYRKRGKIVPRFISVRALFPLYNVQCILRAFAEHKKNSPESSLVILGDGPSRMDLERYVVENHIQDVSFLGQVPNSKIYEYLDDADILLSAPRFDNMPVSLLEGFSAGLLVISSNVGGIPYMIVDGENGLLFEDDDDHGLAGKMQYAIDHPDHCRRMMENAHDGISRYSWEENRERYLRLCQN